MTENGGFSSWIGHRYQRGSRLHPRWLVLGATLAGSGICAGLLASIAPIVITLGVLAAAVFVLGLIVIRRASPGASIRPTATEEGDRAGEQTQSLEGADLRTARALFYVGMLTLGMSAFRLPVGLTISEIAFILAFGLCVLAVLRGTAVLSLPGTMVLAVGIFVFGAAISSLAAQSPTQSAIQVLHAIYVLVLWPWVGVMVLRTPRHLVTALGLWGISGAIDGVGALAQVAGLHLPGTVVEQGRYEGFTTHANDLGGVTGIALVPALIFATRGVEGRPPAPLRWLALALVTVGLVLSGSIAGMTGAVLALLVWLSSPGVRSSSRVVVAVAALCAVGVLAVASGRVTSPLQRVTEVTSSGTGSAHDRISDAQAAWQRIKLNPVVGKGLDTPDSGVVIISQGFSVPYQVHGLPIAAWYETGLFGLVGVLTLLGFLVVFSWRMIRTSQRPSEQVIAWGLFGALAACLVELMTAPLVFQGYDWIVPVMLIAWGTLAARARSVEAWPTSTSPTAAMRMPRRPAGHVANS